MPWKVAFRVQFNAQKFGLKFQQAALPDTGNGIYNVSLMEVTMATQEKDWEPAQRYNAALRKEQEHLYVHIFLFIHHLKKTRALRSGLVLTHINDDQMLGKPSALVIGRLKSAPRPITLRFVDVEAGTVSLTELKAASRNNSARLNSFKAQEEPEQPSSPTSAITTLSASLMTKPTATSSPQDVYKIVLLGATGVGKSSFLAVCIDGNDSYMERRPATLEPEFGSLSFPNPDISNPNKVLKVRIWDTAGQERYRAVTRSHYRRADGAILVYDVTDQRSFDSCDSWLKDLKDAAQDTLKSIMLVENKVDMLPIRQSEDEARPHRFVSDHRAAEYCRANGLLFARTSARMNASSYKWEGQKISDAVKQLVLNIHATKLARGDTPTAPGVSSNNITLLQSSTTSQAPNDSCVSCL